MSQVAAEDGIVLRQPALSDGAAVFQLIQDCPPLDVNSAYAYLLLCHHFSDTSVVAELDGKVVGYISGYVPPQQPDTFFVWQVAVHSDARGRGLGQRMLRFLLDQPTVAGVCYIDTTVSPSNKPSRAMFARLAQTLETHLEESELFTQAMFGPGAGHEEEKLLRIGPFNRG